jgi:tetratricopeptide (TPR) repeat protein
VSRGRDAPPLLLAAAKRLEPLDVTLARETYLEALWAAIIVGPLAHGGGVHEVAKAATTAPTAPEPPRPADLVLDDLAVLVAEGHAAAVPMLKRAVSAFRGEDISREEGLRWLWLACHVARLLWDDESWEVLCTRHLQLSRDTGALTVLHLALNQRMGVHEHAGELAAAASLLEEAEAVGETTGRGLYGALALAAWRGREADLSELIDARMDDLVARGEGAGVAIIPWASALLYNGLGRYEEALAAAQQAGAYHHELLFSGWVLVELIEAAARSGRPEPAADAPAAFGGNARQRHRLGAGDRGPLARAAQRRRGRRAPVSRGDRAACPHPDPRGACPRPSPLRRMAAPRETASGRARAAAQGPRDAHRDGHRGVRPARRA